MLTDGAESALSAAGSRERILRVGGFIVDRLVLDLSKIEAEKKPAVYAPSARRIFSAEPERPEVTFEDMLAASLRKVNSLQLASDDKIRRLATGDVDDISEVVLASSRADIALRLVSEIRNKIVDAYQTLSRISG